MPTVSRHPCRAREGLQTYFAMARFMSSLGADLRKRHTYPDVPLPLWLER